MPDTPTQVPTGSDAPLGGGSAGRAAGPPARDGDGIGVSAHAVFGHRTPPPSALDRWRTRLPGLMLAATLALTLVACLFVYETARRADEARFENAARSALDRIDARFHTYDALLVGTRGLFAASRDVTAAEFRAFVHELDLQARYPGIRGLGFSRRLDRDGARSAAPADAATLTAALRAGGSPADSLWPALPRRDEHHGVVFLEPLDAANRFALGYDMHTDPTRREAMDRARDDGVAAASGRVILKQEPAERMQPGFLLYMPVYDGDRTPPDTATRRATLRGFVYAPFRIGDLFTGIFGRELTPGVAFRVFDGTDTTATALVYTSPGAEDGAPGRRSKQPVARPLAVAGRPWTLVFTPSAEPSPATGSRAEIAAIALFGILAGLVLFQVMRAEIRAREAAERSESLRGRFFAAMSHELRTPVNAVLGYNDLLLAGIYGPVVAPQEHAIQRSQRAARHLLELVNDVLDLSKLEAGKMEVAVEAVRLDELLEDLLVTIGPMAEERRCPLRLERAGCAQTIETDPRRLRQILLNLLSNATKFGAGGDVVVHCTALPHGASLPGMTLSRQERRRTAGDAVVISVSDHGPGIARADQERIFEEFVQLPGTTPGGTGLGLPISRRLAELLGGHLTVASMPGRGSTFSVTVPCQRRSSR